MGSIAAYGLALAVICFVAWIAIRAAIREAKEAAEAKVRAESSEEARKAEQEMADEIVTPITNEEVKDRLRRGDI